MVHVKNTLKDVRFFFVLTCFLFDFSAQSQLKKNEGEEFGEHQIEIDSDGIQNISRLLSSGKDLFSRTVAYDFSSHFFRQRFLGTEHSVVMLNGVTLNKFTSGRPEWSNWGGLNDALRHQEIIAPFQTSAYGIGRMAQGVNLNSSPLQHRKGLKVSLAASNRNYQSRIMITYLSGLLKNDWAVMFSASSRYGQGGFRSGVNYRAYSFLASVEKLIGKRQSLNATLIYAYTLRGKASPMTQEVFDLKGVTYNSYWGYQNDKKRNSREKKILEPIFQVNHEFALNGKMKMRNQFTYQFGSISSSRLDYGGKTLIESSGSIVGGGANPDPSYYQKMPSYFLRDQNQIDYGRAYLAERNFQENGQIDWESLYASNLNTAEDKNAVYVLYEDSQARICWALNTAVSVVLSKNLSIDTSLFIRRFSSENYARLLDLLGGKGYLDIDPYARTLSEAQSNLLQPNRIVGPGDQFKYNYLLSGGEYGMFIRSNYQSKRTDIFSGLAYRKTDYQREGKYENGAAPGPLSLGKSETVDFHSLGLKVGVSHRFNGRHIITANMNYLQSPPVANKVFTNIRVRNDLVNGLELQWSFGMDAKYIWRHPRINAMLSGYYATIRDASKISFYYTDGLSVPQDDISSAYVQEILTGVDIQNLGLEFSLEVPVTENLKLKGVAAIGRSVYASNPALYLTSSTFEAPLELGPSDIKGYYATGGPQEAVSVGFQYSSPNYWWLSSSCNYFNRSYISVSPIQRTKNFFLDTDALPIHDVDPQKLGQLLRQEPLKPYLTLNIIGGKSWKLNNWYLGVFASINNLTNTIYKTGGYQQSRSANYNKLKEDMERTNPLFGNKYWFGYGTTFFTSIYVRI